VGVLALLLLLFTACSDDDPVDALQTGGSRVNLGKAQDKITLSAQNTKEIQGCGFKKSP